ncbi:MAG: alanyl-tRNA editing protein [Candidatus Aminicenantaceae bacterium]
MNKGSKATKRLYFENPYQVEFEAEVIERKMYEGKPALILDQSCFYPESGGQPADRGAINGVKIAGVFEEEDKIIHLLEENISGKKIEGKIDWNFRFDYMQQHSGQHVLSQSFYELLSGETLSFHIGEEVSTVEIDLRSISEKDAEKVEVRANEIIVQDREIKAYFIPEEKIKDIPLRKPPKKEGLIRVVEVTGFDYSACGGTHCRRTGEIAIIKILRWERIRDNIRFEFVCGKRALQDYIWKNRTIRQLSHQLTASGQDVVSSVERAFSELKSQKKKVKKIQSRLAQYEAQEITKHTKEKIIIGILAEKTPDEARFLALNIIKSGDYVVLYALNMEERGHFIFASSETLNLDMRELIPVISPMIKGRGGGSSSLVEIAAEEKEDLEPVLDKAYEFVKKKLEYNGVRLS